MRDFFMTTGQYGLVFVVEAPDDATLAKVLLRQASKGGLRATTLRAFSETGYRAIIRRYRGRKLYVGNLPDSAIEQDLSDKFAASGTVLSVELMIDRDTGRTRGFGFIEMASEAEAHATIDSLNGTDYEGRPMKVNEARPRRRKPDGGGNRW